MYQDFPELRSKLLYFFQSDTFSERQIDEMTADLNKEIKEKLKSIGKVRSGGMKQLFQFLNFMEDMTKEEESEGSLVKERKETIKNLMDAINPLQITENSGSIQSNLVKIDKILNNKINRSVHEGFIVLKMSVFSQKQVNYAQEMIINRIITLNQAIKIIKSKQNKTLIMSKRQAFLRWKLKSNIYLVKSFVDKLVLNQSINRHVSFWRMKHLSAMAKFGENLKWLKFVEIFSLQGEKMIQNRKFQILKDSFLQLKIHNLFQNNKREFFINKKIIDLVSAKMRSRVRVLEVQNQPLSLISEKLKKSSFGKERDCFKKLSYLIRRRRMEVVFRFVDVVNSKLRFQSQLIETNAINLIINKLEETQILKLKKTFNKLKRQTQLESNLNENIEKFSNTIQKILEKIQKKKILEKLKKKAENEKNQNLKIFCEIFEKIFKKKFFKNLLVFQKPLRDQKKWGVMRLVSCFQQKKLMSLIKMSQLRENSFPKMLRFLFKSKLLQNFSDLKIQSLSQKSRKTFKKPNNTFLALNLRYFIEKKIIQNKRNFMKILQSKITKNELQKSLLLHFKSPFLSQLKEGFEELKSIKQRADFIKFQSTIKILRNFQNKKNQSLNQLLNHNKISKKRHFYLCTQSYLLVTAYQSKLKETFKTLKNPKWRREQKEQACQKFHQEIEKLRMKRMFMGYFSLKRKDKIELSKNFQNLEKIIKNVRKRKLIESYWFLKLYRTKIFDLFKNSQDGLWKLFRVLEKASEKKKNRDQIMVEPCYYKLKENAGKLTKEQKRHLENLKYLLGKNSVGKDYLKFRDKDLSFAKLRDLFIKKLRNKVEEVEILKSQEMEIKKKLENFNNQDLNEEIDFQISRLMAQKDQNETTLPFNFQEQIQQIDNERIVKEEQIKDQLGILDELAGENKKFIENKSRIEKIREKKQIYKAELEKLKTKRNQQEQKRKKISEQKSSLLGVLNNQDNQSFNETIKKRLNLEQSFASFKEEGNEEEALKVSEMLEEMNYDKKIKQWDTQIEELEREYDTILFQEQRIESKIKLIDSKIFQKQDENLLEKNNQLMREAREQINKIQQELREDQMKRQKLADQQNLIQNQPVISNIEIDKKISELEKMKKNQKNENFLVEKYQKISKNLEKKKFEVEETLIKLREFFDFIKGSQFDLSQLDDKFDKIYQQKNLIERNFSEIQKLYQELSGKKNEENKQKDVQIRKLQKRVGIVLIKAILRVKRKQLFNGLESIRQRNDPNLYLCFVLDKLIQNKKFSFMRNLQLLQEREKTLKKYQMMENLKNKIYKNKIQKELEEKEKYNVLNMASINFKLLIEKFKNIRFIIFYLQMKQINDYSVNTLKNKKLFYLFQIALNSEQKKINYYLQKWKKKRNVNLMGPLLMRKIILKTPLIEQLALWRMKVFKGRKSKKLHPLKLIGTIKIKNAIQQKIQGQQFQFWWELEKIYNNFKVDFKSYNTLNHSSNQQIDIYFTENLQFNTKNEETSIVSEDLSKITSEMNQDQTVQSNSQKYQTINREQIGKNLAKLIMKLYKKKMLEYQVKFIINIQKQINTDASMIVQEQQKIQNQKKILKFMIKQNQLNKAILQDKDKKIEHQEISIQEQRRKMFFMKNHFFYSHLRKIDRILRKKILKNTQYFFRNIKNLQFQFNQ